MFGVLVVHWVGLETILKVREKEKQGDSIVRKMCDVLSTDLPAGGGNSKE